jgi:hypothetical protein
VGAREENLASYGLDSKINHPCARNKGTRGITGVVPLIVT